jgi:serine/threonine protein kinase
MPVPRDPDELLALVRKSGVVEDRRLDEGVQRLRQSREFPADMGKLANLLIRDAILTHFLAEQFLQGKHRGLRISNYAVLERLGSGAQGSVYLCVDRNSSRLAALKLLPVQKVHEAGAVVRFQRTSQALTRFNHPNLARGLEIGQDDKLHFVAMEFVDGSTLKDIVTKRGPMEIARAANHISQAAEALFQAYLAAGLIHRDIEPTNVMLDRKGTIKVVDFGLARSFLDEPDLEANAYDATVKVEAEYTAPERANNLDHVDTRGDLFALGAVFYFLLTGHPPSRPAKSLRDARPEVPPELAGLIARLLAPDPAQRYQTPVELVEALAPWASSPIAPPPKEEMPDHCPAVRRLMG